MLQVSFLLVCEGSSDAALVRHLEELCILCGADEVTGVAPDLALVPEVGHTVAAKVEVALRLEPGVDLVFVHRDADGPDPRSRRAEIEAALEPVHHPALGVPLVPVQMTEAWLLLDEAQIRRAADNPNGRTVLNLPGPEEVEGIRQPKEVLFELLRTASELSGRRQRKFEKTLVRRRRRLLEELRCDGPVSGVPAWQRLKVDVKEALGRLAREQEH